MGSLYIIDAGTVYIMKANINKEDIIDYLINNNIISIPKSYSINRVTDIFGLTFHCILNYDSQSPFYYSELPYEEACAAIKEDRRLFDWWYMVKLYIIYPDGEIYLYEEEEDKIIELLIQLFENVPTNYTITKINDTTEKYEVSFNKETRILYCVSEP